MANEYAPLETLKLNLSITDTDRDALLQSALTSASRYIDKVCGQRFYLDASAQQRTYNPQRRVSRDVDGELLLTDPIGDADITVESGYGNSWSPVGDYELYPDNALADNRPVVGLLRPQSLWQWQYSSRTRIRVTAKFGWPAVPDEIVQATLIQAARLYKRHASPEGIIGSAEWGVARLSRRDPDVWSLIEDYVRPGFA